MKVFTEEQVRQMLEVCILSDKYPYVLTLNDVVKTQTPIQLPSDEEIKGYINSIPYYGHCTPEYCEGIEDGIKWTLDKIQGGNK
jgi:hypothetical protein